MPWRKDYEQQGLTEAEAQRIIAYARSEMLTTRNGTMWALLWEVLWCSGRRISEVLQMTRDGIEPGGIAFLAAKLRTTEPEPRLCWLPEQLRLRVELYAQTSRGVRRADGLLFPTSASAAWARLQRTATLAGIHRHVHTHMFRHGHARVLARSMQQKGVPAEITMSVIRRALGHRSTTRAAIYLEAGAADVAEYQAAAFAIPRPSPGRQGPA